MYTYMVTDRITEKWKLQPKVESGKEISTSPMFHDSIWGKKWEWERVL